MSKSGFIKWLNSMWERHYHPVLHQQWSQKDQKPSHFPLFALCFEYFSVLSSKLFLSTMFASFVWAARGCWSCLDNFLLKCQARYQLQLWLLFGCCSLISKTCLGVVRYYLISALVFLQSNKETLSLSRCLTKLLIYFF